MERAVEHEQGVRGTETDVGGQSGPSEGWETIARTVRASLAAFPTATSWENQCQGYNLLAICVCSYSALLRVGE